MEHIIYALLVALTGLVCFMAARAALTKKPKISNLAFVRREVDGASVAARLAGAVRIKTVTLVNQEKGDGSGFLAFHQYLFATYPTIAARAKIDVINKYSLIFSIKGTDLSLLPVCFMAHQDVVPAPSEGWQTEPFGGEIKDGFVHGRGSADMKGQLIAVMEAVEDYLNSDKELKRGIYLCFGHDEELTGMHGAKEISEHLAREGVRFEYVLDEGGIVLDGGLLGIKGMLALIGTCEKGYINVELTSRVAGGHASTPTRKTAIGQLAKALNRLSRRPMRAYFSPAAEDLFRTIAPHMNPIFKFLFVNRDVLRPLLLKVLTLAHPVTNSLFRTTFAPTMLTGSEAPNVLPSEARAIVNARINIGQTMDEVMAYIKKTVGKDIEVGTVQFANDPSPISGIKSEAFRTITTTIAEVYDGYIPAPYPFIASSDAKFFYKLSDNVYRYTPFLMGEDDREGIHASNERLSIDNLTSATAFFARLIENSQ